MKPNKSSNKEEFEEDIALDTTTSNKNVTSSIDLSGEDDEEEDDVSLLRISFIGVISNHCILLCIGTCLPYMLGWQFLRE
jgi:hypothetical protein